MDDTYVKRTFDEEKLTQLQHLVMTPSTLQDETKTEIAEILSELFRGQVKKLVYACILTCPWLKSAQGRKGSLLPRGKDFFVTYVASDEQFFCLGTPPNTLFKVSDRNQSNHAVTV